MTQTDLEHARKNHEELINMQQSEARLHWQRNNVFLIFFSILVFSISQFETKSIQIFISISAFVLNIGWFCIQHRSSAYIKAWKEEAKILETKFDIAPIFSRKVKGIQMRRIAYLFPSVFMILWIAISYILIGF